MVVANGIVEQIERTVPVALVAEDLCTVDRGGGSRHHCACPLRGGERIGVVAVCLRPSIGVVRLDAEIGQGPSQPAEVSRRLVGLRSTAASLFIIGQAKTQQREVNSFERECGRCSITRCFRVESSRTSELECDFVVALS